MNLISILLFLFAGVVLFGTPYLIYRLTKSKPGEAEKLREIKARSKKVRKFITEDFKIPKRIEDGETVNIYPVPDSNKVNFYEKDTYAGEGFLYKERSKLLWDIASDNKYSSVTIHRTGNKTGFIKVLYS